MPSVFVTLLGAEVSFGPRFGLHATGRAEKVASGVIWRILAGPTTMPDRNVTEGARGTLRMSSTFHPCVTPEPQNQKRLAHKEGRYGTMYSIRVENDDP